ncbi:MAG: oligosaccharide flippase family protein [Bacteroidetes bacterium]|nr:oligosaccharide flippase family protein [Bacteroidota bacterium]
MGVIQRQSIKNTISSYAGIGLGFLSLLVIQPRLLTPEEIGLSRFLYATSVLMASFFPLGVTNMTIKFFPHFKNDSKGHHGFAGFMLLFPLVGYMLTALLLLFFKEYIMNQYRRESPVFIEYFHYIFLFSLVIGFINVISTYLNALFKSTVPSYLNDVFARLGFIALIFLHYKGFLNLQQFVWGYIGVYIVQLMLLLVYLLREDGLQLKPDKDFFAKQDIKGMVLFGLLLAIPGIASLGLKTLDTVMLGKFYSPAFVGIYAIVSFIPTIIETPLNALERIATTRISHALAENKVQEVRDIFYKSVRYMTLVGCFLFVMVNTNIVYLLQLVGKDFEQGAGVVWIISAGSLVTMMGGVNTAIVFYSERVWQGPLLLFCLVIFSFISNLVLIPLLGINGAATSTALSVSLYMLIKQIIAYKSFGLQPYDLTTIKILLIMFFCLGLNMILPVTSSAFYNICLRVLLLTPCFMLIAYKLSVAPELPSTIRRFYN